MVDGRNPAPLRTVEEPYVVSNFHQISWCRIRNDYHRISTGKDVEWICPFGNRS